MKFSLSSRQKPILLNKCDEIKVNYRDRNIIPDLIDKYPNADINLVLPFTIDEGINWTEIKTWNILAQGRFICCILNMNYIKDLKELGVRFYYGVPAATFYDCNALIAAGVEQILVTAPLFFNMDWLKKTGIRVRVVPNEAYIADIPNREGLYGSWINPNHLHMYEDYVYICEFNTYDINKEKGYYSVYANLQGWGGPLNELITGLNAPTSGAANLLPEEVTAARLNCGQKCQKHGRCHICEIGFSLAQRDRLEDYVNTIKEKF